MEIPLRQNSFNRGRLSRRLVWGKFLLASIWGSVADRLMYRRDYTSMADDTREKKEKGWMGKNEFSKRAFSALIQSSISKVGLSLLGSSTVLRWTTESSADWVRRMESQLEWERVNIERRRQLESAKARRRSEATVPQEKRKAECESWRWDTLASHLDVEDIRWCAAR